ncbi:hypothetical protein QYE76_002919 [Lolium multiflorum]|uniref:CCHC-type domain-containing protein n=1 Tax=Lolium multiflorum TaxID=4521 RepID=A0AAD8RP68_LOLMU|nr:hypothetical protein QYE76_002919 [Lolium multiflorum]
MAPPTRNNFRTQANQMHIEHTKMIDTINILAMERKALRHQHAKKDYLIARLRVKIASLEQLISIPNHSPRGKSNVTCYECGVTGHYSNKCPMKAANNAPRTGSNAVPIAQTDKSTVTCYECRTVGHYSNECPKKLAKLAANPAAPAQQQRHIATRRNPGPGAHEHHLTTLATPSTATATDAVDNVRTTRAQSAPGCRSRRKCARADRPWPRATPTNAASPGPPRFTLSFTVAVPTRQTRSRVLARPVAVDQLAIIPRPCRQSSTSRAPTRPSPTSLSSSLAPPRRHLASAYLADPIPSPEPPRCCHPRRTPHGHLAIINRAVPALSPPHQTCLPPSPRSPRPISPLKSSPELANCSVDRRNPTQKPPSIDGSPSDAAGTSALLIVDNAVLRRR